MELTPDVSDSIFDIPVAETAFYISNITEWRKDIPTPLVSGQDFLSTEFQDMHNTEPFELKDTASECSMDSAYQSQSSRAMRPHAFSRDSHNTQMGSDIYSPSMSPHSYTYQDFNQMQLPGPATAWETSEAAMGYANTANGQDFALFPTQYQSTSTPTMEQWNGTDAQFPSTFDFTYPMASMFTPTQRQWAAPQPAIERPTSVQNTSFTAPPQDSRRTQSQDASFAAFVASPVSTASVQLQTYPEQRTENENSTGTSVGAQSVIEQEDSLSSADPSELRLDEERTKVARSHELYQRGPDKDGKYHCPEEGKPGCTHKATSLKCNYDKFVDSHLKPFRCQKGVCSGVQFSSTACLLRHEREAHGMHGHGARPHLCQFPDCDRAQPGHGFPRRYNLFDHMKRVHQYEGPTTETSACGQGQVQRKPVSRKRKAGGEESAEKRQKVVKITAEQQLQQRREQLSQDFLSKKETIIRYLSGLNSPNDLTEDVQLNQELMSLHDISNRFRRSYGG